MNAPPTVQSAWQMQLIRLFPDLPADALGALQSASMPTRLARGQSLLRAGEYWQHLCWLESGALRLYYLDREGVQSNKNFYLDGAVLWPITASLRDEPINFFIEALEDCCVWRLPMASLERVVASMPSWQSLRVATLSALLDDKMRKEQSMLQSDAAQRYAALLVQHPDWCQRIALKHLASYLGMTDVSLSRLRAQMGLIPR